MAISAATELSILVKTAGEQNLQRLSHQLRNLGTNAVQANFKFDKFARGLQRQEKAQVKSINNTRVLSQSWKELAASVQFGTAQFKQATAEARRLDIQLTKMQGKSAGGGRMVGIAKGAGAVAGAGVFGGVEGALGAGIGLAVGGPVGAIAGGAIGAQVGMVRQQIGGIAEYSAALTRQRKALRLVIGDNDRYARSQKFLSRTSKDLAIPQDVIVRQFTALTASVTGAGRSVTDAEEVFRSIAAGIRGTGGSLEDMKAAMVATAQVFSKGKVSAEELRQQLGERLPGAFTLFAESMGKTPAELDKALEQGKVTLEDFITFSKHLLKEYEDNAMILAKGPEAAGDRFATAMSEYKDELGKMLQPTGAAFQEWATGIVEELTKVQRALNKLFGIGDENKLNQLEGQLRFWKRIQEESTKISEGLKRIPGLNRGLEGTQGYETTNAIVRGLEEQIKRLKETIAETNNLKSDTKDLGEEAVSVWDAMKAGATSYSDKIKDVSIAIGEAMENAFQKMEDALVDFVMTGTFKFRDFAQSILREMARIAIQQAIMKPLGTWFGNLFAKGGVFAQNGIVPFSKGGIVNSPQLFPFKDGIGLMGEAGPEAVMPLRRGPGGRLGVEASGGGTTNISVSVDASGSSVEGDEQQSQQLGEMLAAAIQSELVNQQRPGGLLA